MAGGGEKWKGWGDVEGGVTINSCIGSFIGDDISRGLGECFPDVGLVFVEDAISWVIGGCAIIGRLLCKAWRILEWF